MQAGMDLGAHWQGARFWMKYSWDRRVFAHTDQACAHAHTKSRPPWHIWTKHGHVPHTKIRDFHGRQIYARSLSRAIGCQIRALTRTAAAAAAALNSFFVKKYSQKACTTRAGSLSGQHVLDNKIGDSPTKRYAMMNTKQSQSI